MLAKSIDLKLVHSVFDRSEKQLCEIILSSWIHLLPYLSFLVFYFLIFFSCWVAEEWSEGGEQTKINKKDGTRVSHILYENRGRGVRDKLCTHCKPKDRSWTEVTHQQAPGRVETRPSPMSIMLLANRITTPFCSLLGRKHIVSITFSASLPTFEFVTYLHDVQRSRNLSEFIKT